MSWLFAHEFSSRENHVAWDEPTPEIAILQNSVSPHSNALLAKGSILAEFDLDEEGRTPTRLVHFQSENGWKRRLTIFLNADFSVSVEVQQGQARSYVRVTDWQTAATGRTRLTYAWDAPAKLGLLTIECLETGMVTQSLFESPVPIPRADFENIANGSEEIAFDSRMNSFAVADGVEPIGPAPSIAEGTLVETEHGYRPIEQLQLGDLVLTADNGFQPIRWLVKQELPEVGNFRPIKLCAPYLGLDQDVIVAKNQRIFFGGAEAEYLFGENAVLVEAHRLLGHPSATLLPAHSTRKYYQILLDNQECIHLNGAWSESLFIGRLANAPEILATSRLAQLPGSALPIHRGYALSVLGHYETRTLLDALSA